MKSSRDRRDGMVARMDAPLIAFAKFRLDNGLTVVVHEDRKAPVVAVSIWYHVGSADEPAGKTGFAHLFEHLMFSASENHRDSYFKPFERVGATDMNGTTSFDRTNYFETVPNTALDLALWMESDRMGHLLGAIGQHELDTQRGVVQNEKRQGENRPYGRVWETLLRHAFPANHPYQHTTIGSTADLEAASLGDVRQWFRDYYGAANVTLVLAGDITPALAREKAQLHFGDIPAGPPVQRPAPWIAPRLISTRGVQFDRVPQRRILRQWNVPGLGHADAPLLEIAARVLGGGVTSRLHQRLIRHAAFVDEVSVGLSPFVLAGMFVLSANIRDDVDLADVEAAIDDEWSAFLAEGPDGDELLRAKTTLRFDFIRGLEKVGGLAGKAAILAEGQVYRDDPGAYRIELARSEAATTATVLAAARRWIAQGDHTLVVAPEQSEAATAANEHGLPVAADKPAAIGGDETIYATGKHSIDRSRGAPRVERFPELRFPNVQRAHLNNGIEVILAERHEIPLTQLRLQFNAGLAADRGRGSGTAKFATSMLAEGTRTRDSLELARERQRLGARLGADSGLDTCSVSLAAMNSGLACALDLLAGIVREPAFREADIERLRGQWLAGIRRERSDPSALGLRVLPPLLYGAGHAYGRPFSGLGTEASLATMKDADLFAFHRDFVRPDNAAIFVVGDTTLETVVPLLDATLGDWLAQAAAGPAISLEPISGLETPRVCLIDRAGAPQSQIFAARLTSPTSAPDHLATQLANAVFGGTFTSRLNMNLREDKRWSYGARSTLADALGQRPLLISASVQADRTADAIGETIAELSAICGNHPPTASEIDKVKTQRVRALPGSYETMGSVLSALAGNRLFGRGDDYVPSLKRRIEATGQDEIVAAARRLFEPRACTWLIVGDLSRIEAPIRALGIGEVSTLDPQSTA